MQWLESIKLNNLQVRSISKEKLSKNMKFYELILKSIGESSD